MLPLDPDTPPVGRQPVTYVITPSKNPYPWYGCIVGGKRSERTLEQMADIAIVGGERFTLEQRAAMTARNVDAATCEVVTAKRQATDAEVCFGSGRLPPVFAMECPVLRRRKADGAILVIAPSGQVKHIRADGWIRAPRTKAWQGW